MKEWVQDLISKWTSEGIKLGSNTSLTDIRSVEAHLDFVFPEDFKDFYLSVDGFSDLDWQEHMFTLWPLEMIIGEYNDSKDKDFIGFCDFLIASNNIGYRKSKPGVFKIYPTINEEEVEPVAQSFKEIIEMINTNTGSIY
jgi:hypothetical protein